MNFDKARKIADAVLYEGYVLYPYRASAAKNRLRWQFGVLMPPAYAEGGGSEPSALQTECLIEHHGAATSLDVKLRFLQVQARSLERAFAETTAACPSAEEFTDGAETLVPWDETIEREVDFTAIRLNEISRAERTLPFAFASEKQTEPAGKQDRALSGRVVRENWPIEGVIRVSGRALGSLVKVRIRVENLTPCAEFRPEERDRALRQALASAHLIVAVEDGAFVSLLEPPEWARAAAASCENLQAWPVLVGAPGERDMVLASPIILYDYPLVAAESAGDMCDGTEIDEILTLRTMTLTEREKQEARATDARAAAIIDRADSMPPEMLERLHGAIRYLRGPATANAPTATNESTSGLGAALAPGPDCIRINGADITKGSTVRLQPKNGSADAQDMFVAGRLAHVEAVLFDADDRTQLAVTLLDDPGADLRREQGRYLYFSPEEIEAP